MENEISNPYSIKHSLAYFIHAIAVRNKWTKIHSGTLAEVQLPVEVRHPIDKSIILEPVEYGRTNNSIILEAVEKRRMENQYMVEFLIFLELIKHNQTDTFLVSELTIKTINCRGPNQPLWLSISTLLDHFGKKLATPEDGQQPLCGNTWEIRSPENLKGFFQAYDNLASSRGAQTIFNLPKG